MKGLRAAVSLLTRVPAGRSRTGAPDLARAVPWFPVVGGLLGLALAGTYAGLREALPAIVAATVTLGAGVVLTGAFHEDGLADTADALGGFRTKEEALRILKDPALGTYGVLALVVSALARVGALAALEGWAAVAVLPAAHALSRGAAVGLMGIVPPATGDGLGASYAGATTRREVGAAVAAAVAIGVLTLGPWVVPASLLAAVGAAAVGTLAVRRLGGLTGDVLGAVQQAAEVLILILGAAAVAGGWASPAWWR